MSSTKKSQVDGTAIVIGAGPAGLAAACALSQEGWSVTVFEKRQSREPGRGRQNMVAIRPEALRQLDRLGALKYAESHMTEMTQAVTRNEWDGSVFVWPLETQARYAPENPQEYPDPIKVDDQVPSSFINLGHLEDALISSAHVLGITIFHGVSAGIKRTSSRPEIFTVYDRSGEQRFDIPVHPHIIVVASGKADGSTLEQEIGFKRLSGVKLVDSSLPKPGSRDLRLGPQREIESQNYCVFGLRCDGEMGFLEHVVRKTDTGIPEQPIVEIQMCHAKARHFILQLPRGLCLHDESKVEQHMLRRINSYLGSNYRSEEEIRKQGRFVWGDLRPVVVETVTAPRYVFGDNVILVGDAGMACSPSSGLGADIGMTHDVQAVRRLGQRLNLLINHMSQVSTSHIASNEEWQAALDDFNYWKAQGAVIWSQGSRWFYKPTAEARNFTSTSIAHKPDL